MADESTPRERWAAWEAANGGKSSEEKVSAHLRTRTIELRKAQRAQGADDAGKSAEHLQVAKEHRNAALSIAKGESDKAFKASADAHSGKASHAEAYMAHINAARVHESLGGYVQGTSTPLLPNAKQHADATSASHRAAAEKHLEAHRKTPGMAGMYGSMQDMANRARNLRKGR